MEKKPLSLNKMLRVTMNVIEDIIRHELHIDFSIHRGGSDALKPELIIIRLQNNDPLGQNSLTPIANYLDNEGLSWNLEPCKEQTGDYKPYLELTIFNHDPIVKKDKNSPF